MEKAIKKAIEGGYRHKRELTRSEKVRFEIGLKDIGNIILLDPLFWKALGEACGWGELTISHEDWTTEPKWKYEWHRFIDHLAEGKDAESFFNELLK